MVDGQLKTILDSITNTLKSEYQEPVKTIIEVVEQSIVDGSYLLTGIAYEENEKQEKIPSARIKAIVYGEKVLNLKKILSTNNLKSLEGTTVAVTGKPYMSPKEDLCIITQDVELVSQESTAKAAYESVISQLKAKGEYDPSAETNKAPNEVKVIELIYHSNNYTEHNIAALENYLSLLSQLTGNKIKLNKYPTNLSKPKDGFYSDFANNMKLAHDSQEEGTIVVFYTHELRLDETHYLNRVNVARIGARLNKPFIVITPTKNQAAIALATVAAASYDNLKDFSLYLLSKGREDSFGALTSMALSVIDLSELANECHKENAHQLKISVRDAMHGLLRQVYEEKFASTLNTQCAMKSDSDKNNTPLDKIISSKLEGCINELKAVIHKSQSNVINNILRAQVKLIEGTSPEQSGLVPLKHKTKLIRDELVGVIVNAKSDLATKIDRCSSALIAERHFREDEFKSNNKTLVQSLIETIDIHRCEMVNTAQSSQYIVKQEKSSYRHALSDNVEEIKTDLVAAVSTARTSILSEVTASQNKLEISLSSEPQLVKSKHSSVKFPEGEITILLAKGKKEIEPSNLVKGDEVLINTHNNSSRVVVIETINNKE